VVVQRTLILRQNEAAITDENFNVVADTSKTFRCIAKAIAVTNRKLEVWC
jgi:hypothetical protein